MCSVIKNFRVYTKKCRPVWTLTWRECVSPSIHSGVPLVRDEDHDYNKKIGEKYIKKYGVDNIMLIISHLNTKPENHIRYVAKSGGFSHKIVTPEWQSMGYFLAIVNVAIRDI
jgi:hypothetical protein